MIVEISLFDLHVLLGDELMLVRELCFTSVHYPLYIILIFSRRAATSNVTASSLTKSL